MFSLTNIQSMLHYFDKQTHSLEFILVFGFISFFIWKTCRIYWLCCLFQLLLNDRNTILCGHYITIQYELHLNFSQTTSDLYTHTLKYVQKRVQINNKTSQKMITYLTRVSTIYYWNYLHKILCLTWTLPSIHKGSWLILWLWTQDKGPNGIWPDPKEISPQQSKI